MKRQRSSQQNIEEEGGMPKEAEKTQEEKGTMKDCVHVHV